jgi:hypothetical protein
VPAAVVVAALVGAGIPVDRVGPSQRLEDAFLALIDGAGDGPPAGEATAGGSVAGGSVEASPAGEARK